VAGSKAVKRAAASKVAVTNHERVPGVVLGTRFRWHLYPGTPRGPMRFMAWLLGYLRGKGHGGEVHFDRR
jgi:hypothetical protein